MVAYVGFNVLVLKVESVLPDVDTNDGYVGEERILVGSGGDLEAFGGNVVTLQDTETRTSVNNQ